MILLDTCVLIAALGNEERTDRANRYLRFLEHKKADLWVPAPACMEVLAGCTSSEEADAAEAWMQKSFRILPVDASAAMQGGKLYAVAGGAAVVVEEAGDGATPRSVVKQRVKVDALILGAAISRKAERIVSWDPDMRKLQRVLKAPVRVEDLPDDVPPREQLDWVKGMPAPSTQPGGKVST